VAAADRRPPAARPFADRRAFLVAALLLAGLPPSGIFVAELAILFGGVEGGWGLAAAVAALVLALAMAGFLFHVVRVAVGPPGSPAPGAEVGGGSARGSVARAILLGVPLAVVVVAGLWTPSPLAVALDQVVLVLGGGGG
jgi:formate hydrogenlyase subunit 3/multisubunit Na+/H+ antiporter MnhD subunit